MLPLFIILLIGSYYVGPTAFYTVLIIGIAALLVPFVVVAANKRYLTPGMPHREIPRDVGTHA